MEKKLSKEEFMRLYKKHYSDKKLEKERLIVRERKKDDPYMGYVTQRKQDIRRIQNGGHVSNR